MTEQLLSTYLPGWTWEEMKWEIYRDRPTLFIEREIYSSSPVAIKGHWRLGALHREWDNLIKAKRLRILAPRDHLKTFYFSIACSILFAILNPGEEIYVLSKTDRQARKILSQIKKIIVSSPGLEWLSHGPGVDFWTKSEICLSNGATIYAQGFTSNLRGGHPKLIILDDPIGQEVMYSEEQNTKSNEKYFGDILPMAEPDTKIIIVGTLQREDDLYHVLDPKIYTLKTYDAIVDEEKHLTLYPEKWSWDLLEDRRKEIVYRYGERFFLKEYRNMPITLSGEIIRPEWIQRYNRADLPEDGTDVAGWDLSVGKNPDSGDYTSGAVVRITPDKNVYLTYIGRWRLDFPARLHKVEEVQTLNPAKKIRIEDNTFQSDSVQTLKKHTGFPIEGVKTTINKTQKFAENLSPLFENKKVFLPADDPAVEEFIHELLALPRGKYDDQCDAFYLAIKDVMTQANPRIRWI